ncbi:stalk domain-containing protein [Paenibacillus xerothermodurans]|uniref:Copper oxidase n=1 Tax=Paenibacillus xerothermodurans TaxID=1977292 RepID=A0A2W1NA34_PAEXE|nr:chitobiase/beta-hexosaminidase C-terminal domain-containing protein [Paenibacillus xerothermodurans]PZE20021.1 hypothetical protein CBW46_015170 [Paenibacillus xerothermodurans]
MPRVATVRWSVLLAALLFTLIAIATMQQAHAASVKKVQLYATDGYHTLAGGKQVYVWGYSLTNEPGSARFPGPRITAEEGDNVEVTVTNIGAHKPGADFQVHSMHVDGVDPEGHAGAILAAGQSETRQFTVNQAGSYFYYSSDPNGYARQMGLSGPFIVTAKDSAEQAWTGGPAYDKEYVFHLNEVDPVWHKAAEDGTVHDPQQFHPRYWTINGKSFPDLESDPETMIHGKTGENILVRLINPGFDEHPMHLHGHHFHVVAENGTPLPAPIEKDTVDLAPGETKDILINFKQAGHFPFHSHKILDNTNDGVYPGGLHTMTHIDWQDAGGGKIAIEAGSTHAAVNGEHVMLPVAPFQLKGDTYIPLTFVAAQFGGDLRERGADGSLVYRSQHTAWELWYVQQHAIWNGQQMQLPSPMLEMKGEPMIPAGVLATALCAQVEQDAASGAVTIEYEAGQECRSSEPDVTPPVVSATPQGGTYASSQQVTLSITDNDPSAAIYYTLDESAPTNGSAVYTAPISISAAATLKFIGIDSAGNASDVQTEVYTIEPSVEVMVDALDAVFSPAEVTIKPGTTVTWVLKSSMLHSVTSYDGLFDEQLSPDGQKSFSYTFNEPGTFGYVCVVHPFSMTGTVIVEDE